MLITAELDHAQIDSFFLNIANFGSQEMMQDIADTVKDDITANFDNQTNPSGVPWIQSKSAMKENRKTLIKTGELKNSLKAVADKDSAEVGFDNSSHTGSKATVAEIAQYLHYGVSKYDVPWRGWEILGLSENNKQKIGDITMTYFDRLVTNGTAHG